MKLNTIEEAIQDYKDGKFVIIVDDEDRENEGDITLAADFITPDKINFMALNARGLICVAIDGKILNKLNIPLMVDESNDSNYTAFTVSVDYIPGTTTGISAEDRSKTVKGLIEDNAESSMFQKPGHIFPIKYKEGGVLVRAGHTEASVDLSKLAGLKPAAVMCEIVKDDGTMARRPDLEKFDQQNCGKWHMPEKYYQINVLQWLLDKCQNDEEKMRVQTEYALFEQKKFVRVLQFLIYFIDTLRANNVVWGVGRGSSVASFCLFLIGVHKINPMLYGLDIREFLR